MSDQHEAMLDRAHDAISTARVAMRADLFNNALAEAYYAMFHAARAALAARELHFAKHSGVISAFGSEFAKSGLIPVQMHRHLITAFDDRLKATYDYETVVSEAKATKTLKRAEEFVAAIEEFLREPEA